MDGRISGTWSKGTCTHSQNAGANWWAVDLESDHEVDSVVIYNRMDCCQNRLNGAKVRYRDQCKNKTNLASKWSRCRVKYGLYHFQVTQEMDQNLSLIHI